MVGAGIGVAQLAVAFERLWTGSLRAVVVTRHGNACPTRFIGVLDPLCFFARRGE